MSKGELVAAVLQGENEADYVNRFVDVMQRYKERMASLVAALDAPANKRERRPAGTEREAAGRNGKARRHPAFCPYRTGGGLAVFHA